MVYCKHSQGNIFLSLRKIAHSCLNFSSSSCQRFTDITTRGWCSGSRISCIGCVCKRLKREEKRGAGELELSTGCHARARSCDADVTTTDSSVRY
jgi:hypothetical protein